MRKHSRNGKFSTSLRRGSNTNRHYEAAKTITNSAVSTPKKRSKFPISTKVYVDNPGIEMMVVMESLPRSRRVMDAMKHSVDTTPINSVNAGPMARAFSKATES